MDRSFRQGVLVGILAPLGVVTGVVFYVYKATRKVPFPVRRAEEGELAIRLVEPDKILTYWQQWQEDLEPILDRLSILIKVASERRSH